MVYVMSIKDIDNNDHELTVNDQIVDVDTGMSEDTLNIYSNAFMCFPMQKFIISWKV